MYDPFWLISRLNTAYGERASTARELFDSFLHFRVSHRTKRSLMKSWLKFLPKLVPKRTQERCVGYILLCTISHLRPFLSVWRRLELVCVVAFYYVVRAMARVHLFLPHVACVASVSSRSSSRKLGQEQKKINDGGGGGERRNRLPANPMILKNCVRPRTQPLIGAVRVVLIT